ncbi:hypothetical protein CCACVL1_07632 [Corchorus capsularis]|uniref:Uncharacterized protein n=1 Tax=Corchorus capsularis TaxID=210143 RepID=A0A1R3J4N2_COCAP|nr:hypothetical protein CCACVL1_07632 [Corchorus capsularis]
MARASVSALNLIKEDFPATTPLNNEKARLLSIADFESKSANNTPTSLDFPKIRPTPLSDLQM